MTHYTARAADDISLDENAINMAPPPNEALLAMLRDLDVMKKNMPESDPSRTNQFIREARNGVIYGDGGVDTTIA